MAGMMPPASSGKCLAVIELIAEMTAMELGNQERAKQGPGRRANHLCTAIMGR